MPWLVRNFLCLLALGGFAPQPDVRPSAVPSVDNGRVLESVGVILLSSSATR